VIKLFQLSADMSEYTTVMRVYDGSMQRIYGAKEGGVTGTKKKLHNDEIYNLYPSLDIVRIIK
jgi:hypothetical protein